MRIAIAGGQGAGRRRLAVDARSDGEPLADRPAHGPASRTLRWPTGRAAASDPRRAGV